MTDSASRYDELAGWMDAAARNHALAGLELSLSGTPSDQQTRLREALHGDVERLIALLGTEDLTAMLRTWWYHWDERRAHLLGLRDASREDLQTAARLVLADDWDPSRKSQREVPGTVLTLCWYDDGASHAGEFDDDDGPFADGDDSELADEAVYTIIDPDRLDGNEASGITFEEGRPWVAGARYLEQAQRTSRRLVVVFADAHATSRLIGWSFVESLTVSSGTVCRTGPIVRLRRARRDSIRKLSDGAPLADEYIRPYVPCLCPSFVRRTLARMHDLIDKRAPRVASPTNLAAPTAAARPAEPILAFSWGYEGWGNHTADLVKMVDAVEASRGFAPPVFVDVRYRRQVRAVGFREKAFEKLLGPDRYIWLSGLGNRAVADESLDKMTIDNPSEAKTLLDIIERHAAKRSRVIFFCSCGSPLARAHCHRGKVTNLVIAVARRRHRTLTVHEWPGGAPVVADIPVSQPLMRRLRALQKADGDGRMRLQVPPELTVAQAAALPHLSILRCHQGDETCLAVSGAAIRTAQGWMFPIHDSLRDENIGSIQSELDSLLTTQKLDPFGADPPLPPRWRVQPWPWSGTSPHQGDILIGT